MESTLRYDDHIHDLENKAENLQSSGKYIECVEVLEEILTLKKTMLGENNEEYLKSVEKICELCNLIAMIFLQKENFDASLHFLKKAEILCQNILNFKAITYNNMACFYRKTNKLKLALSFLQQALDIEVQLETPQSLADTHLNMCAVLSQLNRHKEALQHVLISIVLLQDEFLNTKIEKHEKKKDDNQKNTLEDRVSVLSIAYHNLGVELEYLKRFEEAIQTYSKAVKFATENLGDKHQLVENLQKVLEAAGSQIEAQKSKNIKKVSAKGDRKDFKINNKVKNIQTVYNNQIKPKSAQKKPPLEQVKTLEKNQSKNNFYAEENSNIKNTTNKAFEDNKMDSFRKEKGKENADDDSYLDSKN